MNTSISTQTTFLKKNAVCAKMGGVQPNYIDHLEKTDPTFPRRLKFSDTKQAAVFYDAAEIETYLASKKAARMTSTNDVGV